MRIWIVTMLALSAAGVVLHFVGSEDTMWQFLYGYLFGAPLGGLFVRGMVHKYLKPEYFEDSKRKVT